MNFDEVYPSASNSLKADDLKGHEVKAVISGYEVKDFDQDGKKQQKAVLSFEGKEKTLVLNKTNGRRIADAFGSDLDGWKGNEIIMYPDKTDFGGNLVDCIRVRIPAKEAFDDTIPF